MVKETVNILIAENVPSLNKGEMTILGGMLESFKQLGEVNVSMFSALPGTDQPRYINELKVVDVGMWKSRSKIPLIRRISNTALSFVLTTEHLVFGVLYRLMGNKALNLMKADLWDKYANSDVIIIGHDNTYGIMVGVTYFYYIYLPLFARMIRKPIVFYGGSVLKENRPVWLWKKALKFSLHRLDRVTLRERITYERLEKHQLLTPKIVVTGDPAFLLPPAASGKINEVLQQEGLNGSAKPLIGITLTHNCASRAFRDVTSRESYEMHNAIMAQAVDHIITAYDAQVVFLPHCIGLDLEDDDRIIAGDVFQKCRQKSSVKLIDREYSASELKGLIGHCKMFMGERIHSCINALSMGIPTIVMVSKNDQRQDIISMLGQENAVYHVNNTSAPELIGRIEKTWQRSDEIRNELRIQVPVIKEKAMRNGVLLKDVIFPK